MFSITKLQLIKSFKMSFQIPVLCVDLGQIIDQKTCHQTIVAISFIAQLYYISTSGYGIYEITFIFLTLGFQN